MMNLQKLRGKKGIIVGENYSNSLLDCLNSVDSKILGVNSKRADIEYIITAPKIKKKHRDLVQELTSLIPDLFVVNEVELAYHLSRSPIIGITGTNGKTTTAEITRRIFESAQIKYKVAGNGYRSLMDTVLETEKDELILAEIAVYQLEHTYLFRPETAVITNITESHSELYPFEEYFENKCKIFRNQTKRNNLIINHNLGKIVGGYASKVVTFGIQEGNVFVKSGKIYRKIQENEEEIFCIDDLKLIGKHNLENVLAGVAIATVYDINKTYIEKGVKEMRSLPHRMEFIGEINGRYFINDSKSTSLDATVNAIESINQKIVLIVGGKQRDGADFSSLKEHIKNVKYIVLFGETKEKIKSQIEPYDKVSICSTMAETVETAFMFSEIGDYIILSPGCPSQDMFTNYEERGNLFKMYISKLR